MNEMRCKTHFSDLTSSIGVCASCLRERLSSLQPDPNTQPPPPPPPPLVLPRSISPHKTQTRTPTQFLRFYSTPQVDPTHQRKKSGKFGLISKLFRSRSDKPKSTNQTSHTHTHTSTASLSSYASFVKGMSPDLVDSPARSLPRPSPGRVKPSPSRGGISLCLSPLVRPSPARQWNYGSDGGYSGEIRVSAAGKSCAGGGGGSSNSKPNLSTAASFCANRSRKLADFGRLNRNR